MSVPAIAVTVCSTAHHSCQIAASADFDLNPRAAAVAPSSSSSAAVAGSQKSVAGGLSRIFSASSSGPHPSDLGSFRHERSEELGGSYSYSTSPFKCRDPSPVTVFRGPASCGGGSGLSRSPPLARTPREWMGADRRAGKDRIFKGFVRNAISSCLDYTSSDFLSPSRSTATADELPFGLEDSGSDSPNYDPYAMELLAGAQSRHKIFCEEVIIKAFYEAERAHRGQMRASGDPYLHHCVETSVLLAKIGANTTVVAAGLLHDTLDDSFMDYDHIFHTLGANVADLVEGVSRLSHLSKLARDSNTASKAAEADRLHTIFLAMADTRAVLIKLADRLHNMMTLEALPAVKQQRFAKETLEIFAPLASRLGISTWKEQLENLCFKYLHPEKHRDLSLQLLRSADDEALVASASQKLGKALTDEGVSYHVLCGRHKSLYSIYSKMVKKKLNMDQIHDINGLRLIVDNKEDCYKALNIVRRLWHEVIGRFKDYITCPKFNGYQSLHTVVMGEGMLPLEVQIRTKAMHLQAEYGIAAHWRYKEGSCSHPSFVLQMVEWARWVLSWHCETLKQEQCGSLGGTSLSRPGCRFPSHSDDCPYAYTQQCGHDGPMYIIIMENEKMSVQEFPLGTTISDLMERGGEGSPGGSPCSFPVNLLLRPRLNHKPVTDPCQKLKMGDVVELAPELSDKSLTEYREEIQRMYERGLVLSGTHG